LPDDDVEIGFSHDRSLFRLEGVHLADRPEQGNGLGS